MSKIQRRALAMRIVMARTQQRKREGGDLYDDELQELWEEAMLRTLDELKEWLALCETRLAATPRRKGAGQLDLQLPGMEEAA